MLIGKLPKPKRYNKSVWDGGPTSHTHYPNYHLAYCGTMGKNRQTFKIKRISDYKNKWFSYQPSAKWVPGQQ